MLARELRSKYSDESANKISAKLFYDKRLDFRDKIGDGFFFCRGFREFPLNKHHYTDCQREDKYEIVKIDLQQDQNLLELLSEAVGKIMEDMSTFQKAQILAWLTMDRLGGEALEQQLPEVYWSFFNGQEGCEILLGNLFGSVGQGIHRAILFQFLSDSLAIPVKIIYAESGVEVYLWEDNSEYTVNLMDKPGFLNLVIQGGARQESDEIQSRSESSNSLNLQGGSPRSHIPNPIKFLRCKIPALKPKNMTQSRPWNHHAFNDSDVDSDYILIETQTTDSTKKNYEIYDQTKNICEMNGQTNNICAVNKRGTWINETGTVGNSASSSIYGTSPGEQNSVLDLQHIQEDFPGFIVPLQLEDSKTAIFDVNDSTTKQFVAETANFDVDESNMEQQENLGCYYYHDQQEIVKLNYENNIATTTEIHPGEDLNTTSQCDHMSIGTQTIQEDDFVAPSNQQHYQIIIIICLLLQMSKNILGFRQIGNSGEWNSWVIPKKGLKKKRELGRGSYGQVFLGMWNGIQVACKEMFSPRLDNTDKNSQETAEKKFDEDFIREAKIMMSLAHENIVTFYGADPDAKCIVTEYVRHGSVYDLLHRSRGEQSLRNLIRDNLGVRLDIAKQAALGLKYLHSKNIWHLDFKTQNLLVGQLYNRIHIKVCDFGLARIKIERMYNSQGSVGTPEYMAPEVLRNCEKSDKADIYSFGVVLHELVTLRLPWYEVWAKLGDMAQYNVWYQIAMHNKKLKIPEDIDEKIKNLISKCWADEPKERPSIDEILVELEELLKTYPSREVLVCQTQNQQASSQ